MVGPEPPIARRIFNSLELISYFEIAICFNALCFDGQKNNLSFNVTKAKNFIDGYSKIRKLSEEEKKPIKQITIPEGWTVDDANKALEIVSSYRQGLERLTAALDAEDNDVKVQRYCAECPYNN